MSAETVLKNVLSEVGLTKTSPSLSADTDLDVVQLRTFMNATGNELAQRVDWPELFTEETVAESGTEEALPSTFLRLTQGTPVRLGGTFVPVRIITNPADWEFATTTAPSLVYGRLGEGKIQFSSTLSATGAVMNYISNQWVTGKTEVTDNGDSFKVPERLLELGTIWRFKRQKGLAYDDWMQEYEAALTQEAIGARGA